MDQQKRAVTVVFKAMPKGLPVVRIFPKEGKPTKSIREIFEATRRKAGMEKFTFYDLRHTAINNWRLQGPDYFRIMAATGQKTLNVYTRYSTVSKEEPKALVGKKSATIFTNMFTKFFGLNSYEHNYLI